MPSLIEKLNEASEDLLYMSESDYPLEPFVWKREAQPSDKIERADEEQQAESETSKKKEVTLSALSVAAHPTADDVLKNSEREAGTKIEEVTLEKFFHRATKIEDWYEDEEKASAQKFADLQTLLESNLSSIKVFRVGEIEIDVYVVGIDDDGNLAGIKTRVIET